MEKFVVNWTAKSSTQVTWNRLQVYSEPLILITSRAVCSNSNEFYLIFSKILPFNMKPINNSRIQGRVNPIFIVNETDTYDAT